MSKNFNPDEKIKVREAVDIVDVISRFIEVKRAGAYYKCLSPWTGEKTASMMIDPKRQMYFDNSGGTQGDVYEFLMKYPGTLHTFKEAVEYCADLAGIQLSSKKKQLYPKFVADQVAEINEWACQYFQSNFQLETGDSKGFEFAFVRGLKKKEVLRKLRIGYAVKSYTALLEAGLKAGYTKAALQYAGLIMFNLSRYRTYGNSKYYDTFRDRLIFPIFNERDKIVTFGSRVIPDHDEKTNQVNLRKDEGKYVNGRMNTLYKKNKTLYGLNWAKREIRLKKRCIVVEGYMDAAALYQADIWNAVATCGIAFTPYHAQMIINHLPKDDGAEKSEVVVMFDNDQAGINAMRKAGDELLAAGARPFICMLPNKVGHDGRLEKYDIDDFLRDRGDEGPSEILAHIETKKRPFLDYMIETYYHEKQTPYAKAEGIKEIAVTLSMVKDQVLQFEYIKNVAETLNVSPTELQSRSDAAKEKRMKHIRHIMDYKADVKQSERAEKEILRLLLLFSDLRWSEHQSFGDKIVGDMDGSEGHEFVERSLENLYDCINVLMGNGQQPTIENLSAQNKKAGETAAEILEKKLTLSDMKPTTAGMGYPVLLNVLLNRYKLWLIRREIKELEAKGGSRNATDQQKLVHLLKTVQSFEAIEKTETHIDT